MRILIVEDEWLIAEDYAYWLRQAGHAILGPVPSVSSAISLVKEKGCDAVLLDVQLKEEKSYMLADLLVENAIPFAFLTGYDSGELPGRFAGVSALQKPVTREGLINAVTTLAGAARSATAHRH